MSKIRLDVEPYPASFAVIIERPMRSSGRFLRRYRGLKYVRKTTSRRLKIHIVRFPIGDITRIGIK